MIKQNEMFSGVNARQLVAAAAAYIALVIFANLGSLRIVFLAGLSIDGGTFLYPFSFIARDLLHKKAGAALTRFIIVLAAVINLLMFAFIYFVAIVPADPSVGPQTEYALVLLPGLRLVLGSIVAMTAAELIDTAVYAKIRAKYGASRQWLRVLMSNGISVPVDTLIFLLLAFWGRVSLAAIASMFLANIIVKYAVTLCSFGSIYLVKEDRI